MVEGYQNTGFPPKEAQYVVFLAFSNPIYRFIGTRQYKILGFILAAIIFLEIKRINPGAGSRSCTYFDAISAGTVCDITTVLSSRDSPGFSSQFRARIVLYRRPRNSPSRGTVRRCLRSLEAVGCQWKDLDGKDLDVDLLLAGTCSDAKGCPVDLLSARVLPDPQPRVSLRLGSSEWASPVFGEPVARRQIPDNRFTNN